MRYEADAFSRNFHQLSEIGQVQGRKSPRRSCFTRQDFLAGCAAPLSPWKGEALRSRRKRDQLLQLGDERLYFTCRKKPGPPASLWDDEEQHSKSISALSRLQLLLAKIGKRPEKFHRYQSPNSQLPESQVWVNHRGNSILRFHRSRRAQPRARGHAHARVCSRIASLHCNDHYAGDALACACNAPLHQASRRLCSRGILRGRHTSSRLYFLRSILSIQRAQPCPMKRRICEFLSLIRTTLAPSNRSESNATLNRFSPSQRTPMEQPSGVGEQ